MKKYIITIVTVTLVVLTVALAWLENRYVKLIKNLAEGRF